MTKNGQSTGQTDFETATPLTWSEDFTISLLNLSKVYMILEIVFSSEIRDILEYL